MLSKELLEKMSQYEWSGNVRELKNLIERYAITGHLDIVSSSESSNNPTPSMIADVQDNHLPFHEACALFEKQYIQKTLDECRGSVAKAANVLGIHRSLLYKKIAKLGISRTD